MNSKYLSKKTLSKESGFTLIELLFVCSMLAVMAALVVRQYLSYKSKAYNATANADLKNALSSEEAHYAENTFYIPCTDVADCENALPNFKGSEDASGIPACEIFEFTVTGDTLTGTSKHRFANRTFHFDSAVGGSISYTEP